MTPLFLTAPLVLAAVVTIKTKFKDLMLSVKSKARNRCWTPKVVEEKPALSWQQRQCFQKLQSHRQYFKKANIFRNGFKSPNFCFCWELRQLEYKISVVFCFFWSGSGALCWSKFTSWVRTTWFFGHESWKQSDPHEQTINYFYLHEAYFDISEVNVIRNM